MSTNPFDDANATFSALINSEGRQECLDHIEANWTDMRPKSLVAQMERHTRA